ncbi:hypothetical protein [Sphingomonas sp.]|uniref:hypothetical protein n=1 Tax=Sphingomonas sp. TaxID=28214 RepID=UPI001D5E1E96|nr:hypothetical protein [Sphingomonas sp.]MBX9797254.1 hypothetical protein [Sphingomonas sp.]
MSLIILAALSMGAAAPVDTASINRADWHKVATAARRMELSTRVLYEAMTAQEAPRRNPSQQRYCIRRDDVVPGKSGTVCRTEAQWLALGIDMAASQS